MTDLFLMEQYEHAVCKLSKQEMCDIINQVRGYSMTPDTWTKKELMKFLIEGACYYSWRHQQNQTTG